MRSEISGTAGSKERPSSRCDGASLGSRRPGNDWPSREGSASSPLPQERSVNTEQLPAAVRRSPHPFAAPNHRLDAGIPSTAISTPSWITKCSVCGAVWAVHGLGVGAPRPSVGPVFALGASGSERRLSPPSSRAGPESGPAAPQISVIPSRVLHIHSAPW